MPNRDWTRYTFNVELPHIDRIGVSILARTLTVKIKTRVDEDGEAVTKYKIVADTAPNRAWVTRSWESLDWLPRTGEVTNARWATDLFWAGMASACHSLGIHVTGIHVTGHRHA